MKREPARCGLGLVSLLASVSLFVSLLSGMSSVASAGAAFSSTLGAPSFSEIGARSYGPLQFARAQAQSGAVVELGLKFRTADRTQLVERDGFAPHERVAQDNSGEQHASSAPKPRLKEEALPFVAPYTWGMVWDGATVELNGFLSDAASRKAMRAAISEAFKQSSIVDKMALADGAPPDWMSAASRLAQGVALLKRAKISMLWRSVLVEGHAVKEETAQEVRLALLSAMPPGYRIRTFITFDEPAVPVMQPYETAISQDGAVVKLTGGIPSPELRQTILSEISTRFHTANVAVDLRIAAGAPPGWATCVRAGIEALAQLASGTLRLRDGELMLTGKTEDEALPEKLAQEVRAGANRACTTSIAIDVVTPPEPDLKWQAVRTIDPDRLELSGDVPDSETRSSLVEQARKLFPKAEIEDQMRVAPARGERWPTVAESGLELLSRLRDGRIVLDKQHLIIQGNAADTATLAAVRQRLEAVLPKNYSGSHLIEVKSEAMLWAEQAAQRKAGLEAVQRLQQNAEEARRRGEALRRAEDAERRRRERERESRSRIAPVEREKRADAFVNLPAVPTVAELAVGEPEILAADSLQSVATTLAAVEGGKASMGEAGGMCSAELGGDGAERGELRFQHASAELNLDSRSVLDRLAAWAIRCPSLKVDVDGHTDSRGAAESNLRLSQLRAQAVADYLMKSGVPKSQISAIGYGEARPLVPNTSAVNRSRNRRVEFQVRLEAPLASRGR